MDLSSATSLQGVIDAINGSSAEVQARLNRTKTGIEIVDTSGSTANNLIIANGDANNTATKLQIAVDKAASSVDSASLNRQFVSRNTKLDSLAGGKPFPLASIRLTDSAGAESAVNLSAKNVKTVGDVIDAINRLGVGVEAKINDAGDGIVLVDTAGGGDALTVVDVGSGKSAQTLGIAGTSGSLTVAGETVQGINGSRTIRLSTTSETTINDLKEQINALTNSPVNASLLSLGSSGGVRLMLSGSQTGEAGRVAVDSDVGLSFSETTQARDALLAVGGSESNGGVLVTSSTNTFSGLVDDLEFTLKETSDSSVTVSVNETSDSLSKQVEAFVTQFNKLHDKLASLTNFDPDANTVGVLFGSNAALRVDLNYGRLFSGEIRGAGSIKSLAQVGIRLDETGKLQFDEEKLITALASDRAAVEEFFTNETSGFSAKAKAVADGLAGTESGALLSRSNSLQTQIEQNVKRIDAFGIRLDKQRTRLLTQFYNMETAIAKLQTNLTALNQLQVIPPLGSSTS
ncbi:MAG: flagellar filament capping protein FliD [Pirellulaceae bacterium]